MGEPCQPTPADRAAAQRRATEICDSVRNDEAMPLGITPCDAEELRPSTRRKFETIVFQLAQETSLLVSELEENAAKIKWLEDAYTLATSTALYREKQRGTCKSCNGPMTCRACSWGA